MFRSTVVIISILLHFASCELFSATEELRALTVHHETFTKELHSFIVKLENNLAFAKWKLKNFENEQEIIKKDVEDYISNPIKVFTLIKRLTNDTFLIEDNIKSTVEAFSKKSFGLCPKKRDIREAAQGIDRLQNNYNLKTSDLARGVIDGVQYDAKLSAHELFVIGKELFEMQRYPQSIEYFTEALKLPIGEFSEIPIDEYFLALASAHKSNGNYGEAMIAIDEALKIGHTENILIFKEELILDFQKGNIQSPKAVVERLEVKLTRQACNGELHLSAAQLSKFHCRYVSHSYFSMLAPFKLEEVHLDPMIVVYHQAIFENEIEILKELANAKLEKSVIFGEKGDQQAESNIRISEVAWFTDESHKVVNRISKRIEDMTGLTTKTAELLQIQKYGIAGFYKSHYDFIGDIKTDAIAFQQGDRIATFLLYLNEVKKGGATVFPYLKARLMTEKGAAAFWYNILPSGKCDYRTRHSGCPIIYGSKWVANKWLHEFGQEFRRPCELNFTNSNEAEVISDFFHLHGDPE